MGYHWSAGVLLGLSREIDPTLIVLAHMRVALPRFVNSAMLHKDALMLVYYTLSGASATNEQFRLLFCWRRQLRIFPNCHATHTRTFRSGALWSQLERIESNANLQGAPISVTICLGGSIVALKLSRCHFQLAQASVPGVRCQKFGFAVGSARENQVFKVRCGT